ncbi:MAG: thiamine phosphate synthase [Verrucomicrobia bacterium]|nr:thiamine phosphate synthase [Verrucomicrobiota bacterium]
MKPISHCFLYGIVDLGYLAPDQVSRVTDQLLEGGIDMLQLRAKGHSNPQILKCADFMLPLTRMAGVPLILNDHPDLLREVAAEGCHVGQEDYGVAEARDLAGRDCLVGKSTHTLAQALAAEREGADYLGFGPLFPTATKPTAIAVGLAGIRALHEQVNLPIYCIGGVKLGNIGEIVSAGAKRVCIVSDLLLAADVTKRTAEIKSALCIDPCS